MLTWLLLFFFVCVFLYTLVFSLYHVYNRGAGQEVGRSCIILEFKGRKIMVGFLLHGHSCLLLASGLSLISPSAGLWYPPWFRGNGRFAIHWFDRPRWNRSTSHQSVSVIFWVMFRKVFITKLFLIPFPLSLSFHLDHCGALPWFLQKTSYKGRTFMTHATKAIYRWLLSDYVKVR